MSEPPRLYCCVEHRDQKSSTISLIDYLSKAYKEALTVLKTQLKIMRECRNNRTDRSALSQLPEDETERVENMYATSEHLIEQFNKLMTGSSSQHKKLSANEITRESVILESSIDHCESPFGNDTELNVFNEEELLRSPVLMNRQTKPRKNLPATIISDSTIGSERNVLYGCQTSLTRSDDKQTKTNDTSPLEGDDSVLNCTANNDVIECTPIQKSHKKVSFSKLYNVDTNICHTGKKLRQARLAFQPFRENVDIAICQKIPLSKHVSNTDNLLEATNENQTNVDEIIENSPQPSLLFSTMKSRSKSLQEKNPSRNKVAQLFCNDNDNTLKRQWKDKENEPFKESNMTGFSPFSPLLSSTQYDAKLSNTSLLSRYNESSTTMAKRKNVLPPLSGIKRIEDSNVSLNRSKRKLSELDATGHNEDTYFASTTINEKDNINTAQAAAYKHEEDITHLETLSSIKRNLVTSYDRPPPKVNKQGSFHKAIKTKEERAKLEGIDCWECEKYFNNAGLTDEQIKARLKACSRHRSKFVVRQSSPEGLWDEGFPDTQSSTLGD